MEVLFFFFWKKDLLEGNKRLAMHASSWEQIMDKVARHKEKDVEMNE